MPDEIHAGASGGTARAPAGYEHPSYAASLAEFGIPRLLPRSGGWVLERAVGDTPHRDAMGCYPLFACRDWSALSADLEEMAGEMVSLALVADPFGEHDEERLRRWFGAVVTPFKQHFVADLSRRPEEFVSKHHRYYARRALDVVRVERCGDPARFLDDWVSLYGHLAGRHGLRGVKAFSRAAFARQFETPGLVMLRAESEGETVSAHLWYVQGEVIYSHLAATSERGYALMAPYALYWRALEAFAGEARWLNFGAGAGADGGGTDGLTQFKRGWATETRTAYFCGRVFDRRKYDELTAARGLAPGNYFPAYRAGEFA